MLVIAVAAFSSVWASLGQLGPASLGQLGPVWASLGQLGPVLLRIEPAWASQFCLSEPHPCCRRCCRRRARNKCGALAGDILGVEKILCHELVALTVCFEILIEKKKKQKHIIKKNVMKKKEKQLKRKIKKQ